MYSIKEEIYDRDKREKEYFESDAFGLKMSNMYHQIIGTHSSVIKTVELGGQTSKQMLRIYRDVLSDDEGNMFAKMFKSQILESLDNSIDSMAYLNLTKKALDNLRPGNENSFLISPKKVNLVGLTNPDVSADIEHQISAVTRKNQNGDFTLSIIDKQSRLNLESPVLNYSIKGDKSKDIAKLLRDQFIPSSTISYVDLLKKLNDISENCALVLYKMSPQKTGNCHIKEVEAGLKYALWSRTQFGNNVKWPISTLEMHKKFTDKLIEKLNQAGFRELTTVIKSEFEEYKSEKREINPKSWKIKKDKIAQEKSLGKDIKNNEAFSETTVGILAMEKTDFEFKLMNLKKFKNSNGSFVNELEGLKKGGANLEDLYIESVNQLHFKKEEYAIVGQKLDKYKKLKFLSDPFKPLKVKLAKREIQKINNELVFLNEQLLKHEAFIFSEEMDNIKKLKEKHPYLFKKDDPTSSINEKSPHQLLKDITPNQPSISRKSQQKFSLNETIQDVASTSNLRNSNLSLSSQQSSIQSQQQGYDRL